MTVIITSERPSGVDPIPLGGRRMKTNRRKSNLTWITKLLFTRHLLPSYIDNYYAETGLIIKIARTMCCAPAVPYRLLVSDITPQDSPTMLTEWPALGSHLHHVFFSCLLSARYTSLCTLREWLYHSRQAQQPTYTQQLAPYTARNKLVLVQCWKIEFWPVYSGFWARVTWLDCVDKIHYRQVDTSHLSTLVYFLLANNIFLISNIELANVQY